MSLICKPKVDRAGHFHDDTWEIENVTDRSIVLVAVTVVGAHTYDADTGQLLSLPLAPTDDGTSSGVTLRFDDEELQKGGTGRESWSNVEVLPGSRLNATVLNNRELRLTYRTTGTSAEEQSIVVGGNI